MKRLILLRHAKSSWDDEDLADIDRPLAERGLRDAPMMGERLAARGVRPDLILTSTARRARQTARLVEPALRHPALEIETDPAIYLASAGALLEIVAAIGDAFDEVIVVGHNPGFTQLANSLLPSLRLANLPTAGAVAADCAMTSWREIGSAERTLRFYDYPKSPDPV